jgi:hypothetical protein
VYQPEEGQKVMLTHRVKRDILYDNHLVVPFIESGGKDITGVNADAAEDVGVHLRDSFGSLCQPLTLRILPYSLD